MKLQLLAAAASVALLAMPTLASANDQGWYIRGNAGYGTVTDTDFTGDLVGDVEGEGNGAGALGIGYEFGNNWRIELDAAQLWNDMGAVQQAGNTTSDLRLTTGMVNMIYDFSDFGKWQPYVGAGLGVVRANLSAAAHSAVTWDPSVNAIAPIKSVACPNYDTCVFDDTAGALAWNFIAGLGYDITDNLTWDTQYRFLDTGDLDFKGTGRTLQAPIGAGNFSAGNRIDTNATGAGGHMLLTGLRYRFGAPAPKPEPVMYTCWDGSSVEDLSTCPAEPPKPELHACWDGTMVEDLSTCPAKPEPKIKCWDGTMVTDRSACSTPPPPPPPPVVSTPAPVTTICDTGATSFVVYFPWDKALLTQEAKAVVDNAVAQARQCSITDVVVEGHADKSGAASYNVGLSRRRAVNVQKELKADGLNAASIRIAAKGESEPAVPTPDGVREPLNRRAEVVIRLVPSSNGFIQ